MESTFSLSTIPFDLPSLSLTSQAQAPSSQPATIKMEDLETNTNMLTCTSDRSGSLSQASDPASPPSGEHKSNPKKRRSWGQVLPEPKTNLPPRKRAKTDDEKEQRRIERVKRNRLAAHNSRERKRQEVEYLQSEKDELQQRLDEMQELFAQQEAQLRYFRQLCPEAVARAPFAPLKGGLEKTLHQNPFETLSSSISNNTQPHISPKSSDMSNFPSSAKSTPDSLAHTLDSFSMPSTPCAEAAPGTDLTQHSAVSVGLQESPFLSDNGDDFDLGKPDFPNMENGLFGPPHPHQSDNLFGNLGGDFNLFSNDPLFTVASDVIFPQIQIPTNLFDSLPDYDSANNPADDVGGSFDGLFADTLAGSGATVSVSDEPGIASV